jgi:hypothetical protein
LALVAEEFRIADFRSEVRGYQELARRVEKHNRAVIERKMIECYKAMNEMDDD